VAAIGEAVRRMEAAGYRLEADGGALRVSPAERLNEVQRDWLRRNKPALVRHVKALALPDVRRLVELFDAEVMAYEEHSGGVPADNDTTPPVFPIP
jgi:hypothetical protein